MEKVRKELRDELYKLRLRLEIIKKERVENDLRVKDLESRINNVRRQIAQELLNNKEGVKDGKRI